MQTRDTKKYELRKGNQVVYVGITNDLGRREQEHRRDKEFGHMKQIGRATTPEAARKWEKSRIDTYKRNHGGNMPRHNKIG